MFTFPKAKLGDVTAITITSPDLTKSLTYYQQLGFSEVYRADFPFPWILISDSAIQIMLRLDKKPYIALTYYVKEMEKTIAYLQAVGVAVQQMPTPNAMIQRYLIPTDEGHNVSLVSYIEGFTQPTGSSLLNMPPQDYSDPEKYANKACGLFGELAFPVKNLERSLLFWEKLGFRSLSKNATPYPWAILSDGLSIIGLHETAGFSDPTITFFAVDMPQKIDNLLKKGLTTANEDVSGRMVLSTFEQQHINLFKLGM